MSFKNYKYKKLSTGKIQKVINEIENPDNPNSLHKFKNTAIYSSLRYALSGQQQDTENVEFSYDSIS